MQRYKALFLTAIILCSVIASRAQFRIYGGPQMTSAKYTVLNNKQPTEFKLGFMAGIGLTTQVEGPLYFAPSLYFSRKGYNVTFNKPSVPPNANALNNATTINSVSFAPLLQWNFSNGQSHLFARLGPGVDVAVSGREVFDSTGGKQISRNMVFGPTSYSPATAFANLHLGFQHQSGLTIFALYEHGLSSLNNADFGPMILQRVAGVSLGWRF